MKPTLKSSLYTALFVAFVDLIGVGLIYPLFSAMLFDNSLPLLPLETSHKMRGFWLGLLLAAGPFFQFFGAPIWGAFSDTKGRKKPLQISIVVALLGYIFALMGVTFNSIMLLLFARAVIGFASGNMAIVQATIADISSPEEKAKNFGLFGMAHGAGFTLGPFFGSILSSYLGYNAPFQFATLLVVLNLFFALFAFKESHFMLIKRKLSWHIGLSHLKKAFHFVGLRSIFLCYFLHVFGWTFFFEFSPIYLIKNFGFSSTEIGLFYGTAGAFYALSTGFLIRPVVQRFKPRFVFFAGNLFTAIAIFCIIFLPSALWLWPLLCVICYFVAHVQPTAITIVSNAASSNIQGEALGITSSLNAAAFVLSAAISGSFVGDNPSLSMNISSGFMLLSSLILLFTFRRRLFT